MNNQSFSELDFTKIFKQVYNSRKIILIVTCISILIGITLGLLLPFKFSSSTVFIPQNQDSNPALYGVANLVGINVGNSNYGGEIPTSLYPQIGESTKFKRKILNKIIDIEKNITLKEFIIDYYNLNDEKSNNLSSIYISKTEESCFKILSQLISISVNIKDGFVTINATMPRAEYSALLANYSREILQQIIINNKIESAKQNLLFSQKQLNEKKIEFDEIQSKLSFFKDSNLNLVNSSIIGQQEKLEAEFEIINAVVTELSKQVEQAKLQVKKDTPVFSTIKEAVIPNTRSSPARGRLVIIFTVIGFVFSTFYILMKKSLNTFISEIIN